MTKDHQPPPRTSPADPFLDEVHRLKREAVAGLDMTELAKKLRAIEERYKDRLLPTHENPGTSAA